MWPLHMVVNPSIPQTPNAAAGGSPEMLLLGKGLGPPSGWSREGQGMQLHQPSPCHGAGGMLGWLSRRWGGKVGFCSDGEAAAVLAPPSTDQFPAPSTCTAAALRQCCRLRAPVAVSLHESQQKMTLTDVRGTAESWRGQAGP